MQYWVNSRLFSSKPILVFMQNVIFSNNIISLLQTMFSIILELAGKILIVLLNSLFLPDLKVGQVFFRNSSRENGLA